MRPRPVHAFLVHAFLAHAFLIAAMAGLTTGLTGCMAYDVASTTVGAATSVVSTGVSVTGDVVSGAAGAVAGGDSDADKDHNR